MIKGVIGRVISKSVEREADLKLRVSSTFFFPDVPVETLGQIRVLRTEIDWTDSLSITTSVAYTWSNRRQDHWAWPRRQTLYQVTSDYAILKFRHFRKRNHAKVMSRIKCALSMTNGAGEDTEKIESLFTKVFQNNSPGISHEDIILRHGRGRWRSACPLYRWVL